MTEQHRITPPPSLVEQWCREYGIEQLSTLACFIADKAAEWGADQELELCCEWLTVNDYDFIPLDLHAARRPKPPSLKQQALETLKYPKDLWSEAEVDTIRRALEALPDE